MPPSTMAGPIDDAGQRDADPGDHHRPPFDAPEAVDPFLQLNRFDQILEMVVSWLVAQTVDLDLPWTRLQRAAKSLGIVLARPELEEIVVTGDLIERIQLLVGGDRPFLVAAQRRLRRRECSCPAGFCGNPVFRTAKDRCRSRGGYRTGRDPDEFATTDV